MPTKEPPMREAGIKTRQKVAGFHNGSECKPQLTIVKFQFVVWGSIYFEKGNASQDLILLTMDITQWAKMTITLIQMRITTNKKEGPFHIIVPSASRGVNL
ncbi:hypothetical protein CDL15_Pgr024855 [Punica granatum]|uniref:Uncharacterized protein n=1 Tax=Punica granatum TaxID=22663 RepID=A0A218Y3Y7_PUNGR|nr:hypothetical protein CDL15_Pgr024855 [Punica granatum]